MFLNAGKLELHVRQDKCVLEVSVNEGEACLTYIGQAVDDDEGIVPLLPAVGRPI